MGVPALKCDFRPVCCSFPTHHRVVFVTTASNTRLGVSMPFNTSRPKPPIPRPFIPQAQAPSPAEETEMAFESPRAPGRRNMQGIVKHRAQPAQTFQSSPSTATPPITPPMEHHDDVNSSFSYPASLGGSHHFPSRPFRFSFKTIARQPSTSHHRKGYSTTTAEEYLRSVAKRDSDDGSKYGVLADDPFRSESRLGGGDSDYYEGARDENGDESDYYAEDTNAKYMAAANPSPMSEGETGWPHNVREDSLKEEEGDEDGQQLYQEETPVHRVLETPPPEVKVTPSNSSTPSTPSSHKTKRPLFVSPFSPFGRMASVGIPAGIRLRFSSIVGKSAPVEPSPPPILVVPPQPIDEEPLSPVSTLNSPLAASPPQIGLNLPEPELSLDPTAFPQPAPFRPRFLARPPSSVAVPPFSRRASAPLARNSGAGGLQLRLQASPHLLSPSIPPSPVTAQHWPRESDELSSPSHSLWTVDLPNTPGTSRPTTLWVVGKLQDHLERQARTPGGDQMSDFSFDLTPPARFATLPTLDEDGDEAGSYTIHTHTRTNSMTSVSSRPAPPRRAPPPLPAHENGGRLSLISEVDSSVLDTPLPPVTSLVPPSSTASSSSATFRQQLEDDFPAPPLTKPDVESDNESYRVPSLARTATPSPPPPPPKSQPQLKPSQSVPRRRSEDSFRAIPVREADLEEAIRLARAREEAKQRTQVVLEDPSDEDSAYGEDEFSEQESDAQVIPITYSSSPLVTPPPFQRRLPSGVSKVLRYFFS